MIQGLCFFKHIDTCIWAPCPNKEHNMHSRKYCATTLQESRLVAWKSTIFTIFHFPTEIEMKTT
jgi:hypothetical protein